MRAGAPYGWAADAILILHVAVVVFIVGTVPAILIGNLSRWELRSQWINSLWFRLTHLSAILFVVAEAWLQIACPLTTLERWLRQVPGAGLARVGNSPAAGCIESWLGKVLYFTAPWWVFAAVYSLFAALVVYTWVKFPPRCRR
ncbi:MAG: DUF2784 domain-containing protein [Herminiimonas sp.]|nr:DUF2784 domain-containing protein [Herminiimonas sp.]